MLESLKEHFKKKESKPVQITKQHIVVGATFLVAMGTIMSISTFSPGDLKDIPPRAKNEERNVIPKITQSNDKEPIWVGLDIEDPLKGISNNFKRMDTPKTPAMDFFDKLPTTMPDFNQPSFDPVKSLPTSRFSSSAVYARHARLTSEMKNGLSSKFILDRMSDAPVGNSASRFSTSYVITSHGESTERYDLVSITRTDEMDMIKTAKDALNVLIEESDAVNIIDYTDNYLIYDLGGSRGYQIGKIMVDDQGIYILGYINFTTNNMPYTLKMGWINRLTSVN
mgnify:CR=1 FL=1|jgi:hypothetical protein